MSPLSRFFNVFSSPGAVFEDVKRDPRGWWVPLLICGLIIAAFGVLYVSRYDLALVLREQLKDNAGIRLVAGLAGQAEADKAIERAVGEVAGTAPWVMKGSQVGNIAFGFVLVTWFFAFLYGLIALVMGWLGEARTSRLWVSLGVVLGAAAAMIAGAGALQFARGAAARGAAAGGEVPAVLPPAPAWIGATQIALSLIAAGVMTWGLFLLAREPVFGRILGTVTYAFAPAALAGLVGIAIVLLREPDATPFESLVPDNLTSLLGLEGGGAIASLGSSLALFSIWSLVLRALGLAKVLGKSAGAAAGAVLIPWGVWVLGKAVFSALVGG